MIAALNFHHGVRLDDGRTIRRPTYNLRAMLPIAAACDIANAVSDRLSALLARKISLELIEPVVLQPSMHETLLCDCRVVRARGASCDVFIVLRRNDERRLIRAAFAASDYRDAQEPSKIESWVAQGLSHALALACAPLCGIVQTVMEDSTEALLAHASVYFEMRIVNLDHVSIGVAVTRDVVMSTSTTPTMERFYQVPLSGRVALGPCRLTLAEFMHLRSGSIVPLEQPLEGQATLLIGRRPIRHGCPGIVNGHFALRIEDAAIASPR